MSTNITELNQAQDSRTIYRVLKNKNNPYVQINKTCLHDERLSWKSKGMMAYMLSMPDDWIFYTTELVTHSKDGIDSVKAIFKELKEFGYIQRHQERKEDGTFGRWVTCIYEEPQSSSISPKVEKPLAVKPTAERPLAVNPPLLINNNTKETNYKKTITTKTKEIHKPKHEPQDLSHEPDPNVVVSLMEKLEKWAIAETLVRTWLKRHSTEYILCKIEYTKSYATKNRAGLLRRAIENDYKLPLCKQAKLEPKPAEPVYPSHEENLAWYASLSDEDKLGLQKEAVHKQYTFEGMLKSNNVSVLNANFVEHTLFKMLMEIIGRVK